MSTTSTHTTGTIDGGKLNASREALLAGRECKNPYSTESGPNGEQHMPRRWTICPACFPGE